MNYPSPCRAPFPAGASIPTTLTASRASTRGPEPCRFLRWQVLSLVGLIFIISFAVLSGCGGPPAGGEQSRNGSPLREVASATAAQAASRVQVQKAYIAYYGRPADPDGLAYWAARLDGTGGDWGPLIDAFGNSAEAAALLAGLTSEQKIDKLYAQLFGRNADTAGRTFYANGLASGSFTLPSLAINIINGVSGPNADATVIANKLAAADLVTASLNTEARRASYSAATVSTVRGWLADVTTVAATQASVDSLVSTIGALALGSFRGNIILGAPTDISIRANIFSPDQDGLVSIAYGMASGVYDSQTSPIRLTAGRPLEIALEGLTGDRRYYYRLSYQRSDSAASSQTEEYTFHTARPAGSTFTFGIQGDSHPEREKSQFDSELYRRTLLTAAANNPDFYITLGDDFSVDTLDPATVSAAAVTERYTIQRPYLGLVGRSAPVFLVNGNHEQAARYLLDGTPDNVAVWAQNARNSHYSQPGPDGFYRGNSEQVPYIGLLRNYYAWHWGDALFVVIDPYWGSPGCVDEPFNGGPKRTNLWEVTLGEAQYQWFKTTLEQSTAKFKFVFAHHVLGTGRGGIELAGQYEWGGRNGNGNWGFTANRPGWAAPIHQLMAANGVTIFFQGHDHVWARQELDGVVYQTLPEPADPNSTLYFAEAFLSGTIIPNTGYTRVTVSPAAVRVDYIRTYLPGDEGPGKTSGATFFSYSIPY